MRKQRRGAGRFRRATDSQSETIPPLVPPWRAVVAIVVGGHPRRMVCPRHLSPDHSGDVDDHPIEICTGAAARFFDAAVWLVRWACVVVCCPLPFLVSVHVRPSFPGWKDHVRTREKTRKSGNSRSIVGCHKASQERRKSSPLRLRLWRTCQTEKHENRLIEPDDVLIVQPVDPYSHVGFGNGRDPVAKTRSPFLRCNLKCARRHLRSLLHHRMPQLLQSSRI